MDNNDFRNVDVWAMERRAHKLRAEATARGARTALNWVKARLHLSNGATHNARSGRGIPGIAKPAVSMPT